MLKIKPTKLDALELEFGKVRMINRCTRLYQVLVEAKVCTKRARLCVPIDSVCVTFFHNTNQLFTDGTADRNVSP